MTTTEAPDAPARGKIMGPWFWGTLLVLTLISVVIVTILISRESAQIIGQPHDATCSASVAQGFPGFNGGTEVQVTDKGPDVVTVNLVSDFGHTWRMSQQVVAHGTGAEFNLRDYHITGITVSSPKLGWCTLPVTW